MYFQYSHDTLRTTSRVPAATRFLKIHRIYVQGSPKNQDVLMVGKSRASKLEALNQVKNQLIKDGYTKISFYDADTKSEKFLHGNALTSGKSYRVVYTANMSHPSSTAAQALAGDLIGATGDQSLGEAISGDKTITYECRIHKQELNNDYYAALIKLAPDCKEVINLLKNADSEADYKRLGELLTPTMKSRLKEVSQALRKARDLTPHAAFAAMPADLLEQYIREKNINPYGDGEGLSSPFERLLVAKRYDAIKHIIKSHTDDAEKQKKFCEILTKATHSGHSYIKVLREDNPDDPIISRASYLVVRFQLDKYQDKRNVKRLAIVEALQKLFSTFDSLDVRNESALIGLILLSMKDIAREYSFMSPQRGGFFGSQIYSHLEETLNHLGIDSTKITAEERQKHHQALASVMGNNPTLFEGNAYILKMLSKEKVNLVSKGVGEVQADLIKLGQVKKREEIPGLGDEPWVEEKHGDVATGVSFLEAVIPSSLDKSSAAIQSARVQLSQDLAKSIVGHQSKDGKDRFELRVYKALARVSGCHVIVVDEKQTLKISPETKEIEPKLPSIFIKRNEEGSFEFLAPCDLSERTVVEIVAGKQISESMAGRKKFGVFTSETQKQDKDELSYASRLVL